MEVESIIAVVVLVIVYSVSFIIKTLSKKGEVIVKPLSKEPFPTIEVLEPSEGYSTIPESSAGTQQTVSAAGSCVSSAGSKKQIIARSAQHTASYVKSNPPSDTKHKQGKGIAMKSLSDAKRAFIYSEIFNRKY